MGKSGMTCREEYERPHNSLAPSATEPVDDEASPAENVGRRACDAATDVFSCHSSAPLLAITLRYQKKLSLRMRRSALALCSSRSTYTKP
jgi:hypothetical protein